MQLTSAVGRRKRLPLALAAEFRYVGQTESVNTADLNLLIPEKPDAERDAVAAAWEASGGSVNRLARFWEPPQLPHGSIRVYGNETFCLVLQEKLALRLETPADDLMLAVPAPFLHRSLAKHRLVDLPDDGFPLFAKSLIPKLIASRVYASAAELAAACVGLDPLTEFLVSDPVVISAEARSFVLDGDILDLALYEGQAHLKNARVFIESLLSELTLPRTVVVDVGLVDGRWCLIEFNATWGAGLNGCHAGRVLPAIAAASDPAYRMPHPL